FWSIFLTFYSPNIKLGSASDIAARRYLMRVLKHVVTNTLGENTMSRKTLNLIAALVIFLGFGASAAMASTKADNQDLRPKSTCYNEDGSIDWGCVCLTYPHLCFGLL